MLTFLIRLSAAIFFAGLVLIAGVIVFSVATTVPKGMAPDAPESHALAPQLDLDPNDGLLGYEMAALPAGVGLALSLDQVAIVEPEEAVSEDETDWILLSSAPFTDSDAAHALAAQLRGRGIDEARLFVAQKTNSGRSEWRVELGPFPHNAGQEITLALRQRGLEFSPH